MSSAVLWRSDAWWGLGMHEAVLLSCRADATHKCSTAMVAVQTLGLLTLP